MTVTPTDLATYLGVDSPDTNWTTRAQAIIDQAVNLCSSLVNPLPTAADAVVLDVSARAFTNPANAQSTGMGPFSASFGPVGGGLWLTRQNKATLRRLTGGGGAFSVDLTPANAATDMPWWDTGDTYYGLDAGDWDSPV